MVDKRYKYIPALRFRWLTDFYDSLIKSFMPEEEFKHKLISDAQIQPGQHVLDLGCGTATLTILIKEANPQAEVIGLDIDHKILEIARKKITQTGLDIRLDSGSAFELPYEDNSFDFVYSSLMLHHLTHENKIRALQEVFRVLRPRGGFYLADFGKPKNVLMNLVSLIVGLFEEVSDNFKGLLPTFIEQAGFRDIREFASYNTLFGTISLLKAWK